MADTALPSLTAGAAPAAADLFYTTQSGNSRKVTGAQLQVLSGFVEPPFVAGRWYAIFRGIPSSGAVNQNLICLAPFILPKPITMSDLGCRVTTALAANNFQLAIYASDPATAYPTGNALAVTGNISTAVAAVVSADITGANVTLAPGLYWSASNQSGATSALQSAANLGSTIFIGSTTITNVSTAAAQAYFCLTFAQTYNTWPDLTGQTFGESPSTSPPTGPFLLVKAA